MSTVFAFKILECSDDSLPLQYQFLVVSSLTPNVSRTLSLRTSINTYDGPLFKLDSHLINAIIEGRVYDAYNDYTSKQRTINMATPTPASVCESFQR